MFMMVGQDLNLITCQPAGYENQITSLEEGVKDYVQNYLAKETGYL